MRCAIKVAAWCILLALIGADLGLRIAEHFSPDNGSALGKVPILVVTAEWATVVQGASAAIGIIFSAALVWVGIGQWFAAKANAAAANANAQAAATQARVAEQTITTLERPHLFTLCENNFAELLTPMLRHRNLYDHPTSDYPLLMDGAPLVRFKFRNYGKSPAIIIQVAGAIVSGASPPAAVAPRWLRLPSENVLRPGDLSEEISAGVLYPFEFSIGRDELNDLVASNIYWWFYGFVIYEDVLDTEHTHYFCWRFDYGTRTFEPVPSDRNFTEQRKMNKKPPDDKPVRGSFRVSDPPPRPPSPSVEILIEGKDLHA